MKAKEIKSELMDKTIELVDRAGGDVERVTVREISAAAGVGVGLVNYHFGSKEELFHCCARQVVKEQNDHLRALLAEEAEAPARARLERLVLRYCAMLVDRPGLVRMALLDDLRRGDYVGDDIDDTMTLFLPVVTAAMGRDASEDESRMTTHVLVHGLQAGFLRSASVCARIGLNFYDENERSCFVYRMLRQLNLEG